MERERGDGGAPEESSEEEREQVVAASGAGGWLEICAADNPKAWVACDRPVEIER